MSGPRERALVPHAGSLPAVHRLAERTLARRLERTVALAWASMPRPDLDAGADELPDAPYPFPTRMSPGLVVLVVDQSAAMAAPFRGSRSTLADAAALAVNKWVMDLALRCARAEDGRDFFRDYFHIAVVGHGDGEVRNVSGGREWLQRLSALAEHPIRIEKRMVAVVGMEAGVTRSDPIWIDALASGEPSLAAALDMAAGLTEEWLRDWGGRGGAWVINITSGAAGSGDPRVPAAKLRRLSTAECTVVLATLHLANVVEGSREWPASAADAAAPGGRVLFEMTSLVPRAHRRMWAHHEVIVREGGRAYALDMSVLGPSLVVEDDDSPWAGGGDW